MTGTQVSEFDHTGDRGIEVTAPTLARLFEAAADGMFGLLFEGELAEGPTQLDVRVTGSDLPDLMVKWLDELNFVHLTEGVAPSDFRVSHIDEREVRAVVSAHPLGPGRPAILTEIKAVTYHDLVVEPRNGGWFARIIFDI